MNSIRINRQLQIGTETFGINQTVQAKGMEVKRVELPAAKSGTLTTRTSATVGTITGLTGHGIITADVIDVYWTGGSRRGVVVGTVATNSIPISGGSGDDLPVATTALTFAKVQSEPLLLDGSSVVAIAIYAAQRATVVFNTSGPTEAYARVVPAGTLWTFVAGQGDANPITGDAITTLGLTQDSTIANQTVLVAVLFN
jgi:hypothetical protein